MTYALPIGNIQHFRPEDYYNGADRKAGAGKSSNGQMPMFTLESEGLGAGLHMALGWSGQWNTNFEALPSSVRVTVSLENASFALLPDEHIRHIRILASGFGQDDLAASGYHSEKLPIRAVGTAILRRTLLDHYSVRDADGELIYPKIANFGYPANVSGGETWQFSMSEEQQLEVALALKSNEADVEEHWIDVGWGSNVGSFYANMQYPLVKTAGPTFPRSLKPIFDLDHNASVGKRSLNGVVWTMAHGSASGSYLNKTHPEWMLLNPQNPGGTYGLDLSQPQCVDWITQFISDTMIQWNYEVFRHEMGMDYANVPFWSWKDSTLPNPELRRGITEVKWIEGQYQFWDGVRAAKPGAVIDHCAGGGRNIDLETISRGIWKWRSDFMVNTTRHRSFYEDLSVPQQSMTMGLGFYHPMNAHFAYWADAYAWRSAATTGIVIAWDVRNDTLAQQHLLALAVAETKRLRKYTTTGDLWWLTPQTLLTTSWAAWQYHMPDTPSMGMAVFFRRSQAEQTTMVAGLRGIDNSTDACYQVALYDENYALTDNNPMTGKALRSVVITLPERSSSAVLEYVAVPAAKCNGEKVLI